MFIRWIILVGLLVPAGLRAQGLKPYNKAFLWQGFKHKWSYNHRINRLGNYISKENDTNFCFHSSASGLGPDSAYFTSFYTKIESPNLVFKETIIKISVYGKEGDLLNKIEEVAIPAAPWFQKKQHYRAFINGFEITSLLSADQLQLLGFHVEDPYYCDETKEVKFKASMNLSTNCRTVECPIFSNQTAYELKLHVLLVGFDGDDAQTVDAYFTKDYVWDKMIEVSDLSTTKMIQGQSDVYPLVTAGIRGISWVLDSEHWVKEIDNHITPLNYNSTSGALELQANQLFVEWRKGMERFAVEPKKAMFAKRNSGFAILQLFPTMMQFKEGKTDIRKVSGSSWWKGWNKNSYSDAAIKKIAIY